jgi:hypothetical protein
VSLVVPGELYSYIFPAELQDLSIFSQKALLINNFTPAELQDISPGTKKL